MIDLPMAVVVPVYNDPKGIQTTLDTLLAQGTNCPYNIHVVDNNSTDETPEVIRSYDHEHVTLHHETDIQSSYAARNIGIRNTNAELLAFVDSDMTVPENWLGTALQTVQRTDTDYMGCNVELTLPENPPFAARYDHHTGFPIEGYIERQHFAPTCCLFVRREVFEEVGLFDHRLISGGDKEFGNRVHDAGYELHFSEDVTMFHPTRDSLPALVKKDLRVGRGLCQLQQYHPNRYGTPGIPPRPSGVKSPDGELSINYRLAFETLSKLLTAVRGIGYYHEYVSGQRREMSDDGIPTLK